MVSITTSSRLSVIRTTPSMINIILSANDYIRTLEKNIENIDLELSVVKDIDVYIEKRINDNFSNIVTENKTYKIRSTIQNLEHDLNEGNGFIKTHRSYIVNSKNIRNINFEDGEIKFSNNQVALLSRNNKKKLREKYR